MMDYTVRARAKKGQSGVAECKQANLTMDTTPEGQPDAFNPAELLLASVAACMIKNIERVAPMLGFEFRGAEVEVRGFRQEKPPLMEHIEYVLTVDTDEPDRRLELLHANVKKHGTIFNTLAKATELTGSVRRARSLVS
jgi:uncharacterized OsmC-like protein